MSVVSRYKSFQKNEEVEVLLPHAATWCAAFFIRARCRNGISCTKRDAHFFIVRTEKDQVEVPSRRIRKKS